MGHHAHRTVQQLLNERRSKVSDSEFFTSRAMSSVLENIAAAQTRRYTKLRITVTVHWSPAEWSANTNNRIIRINAGYSPGGEILTRKQRYEMVMGLFSHELGHVLFTDFSAPKRHIQYLRDRTWFPEQPKYLSTWSGRDNENRLFQWLTEFPAGSDEMFARGTIFDRQVQELHNILEDGHIEELMLRKYPGKLGQCLETVRQMDNRLAPPVSTMLEKVENNEIPAIAMYKQMLLDYAKFGVIRYGEATSKTPCVRKVYSLMDAVDNAVNVYSSDARCAAVNEILLTLWPEMQEYMDALVDEYLAQKSDEYALSPSTIAEISENANAPIGSTEMPVGSGQFAPSDGISNGVVSVRTRSAAATKRTAASAGTGEAPSDSTSASSVTGNTGEQDDDEADGKASAPAENDGQAEDDAATAEISSSENGEVPADETADKDTEPSSEDDGGTDSESSGEPENSNDDAEVFSGGLESENTGHREDVTSAEKGRIPRQTGVATEADGDGGTIYDDTYEASPYKNAADDIDRILTNIAADMLEDERAAMLQQEVNEIDFGPIHNGCTFACNRITDVNSGMVELYDQVAPQLLSISKQLQRNISKQIRDRRNGTKMTGLVYGRRIEGRNLSRTDGRVFYKRSLPNDEPLLSVALLLDESGSMSSQNRVTYARAAAIILQDFCAGLDIPFMCYGHSTGYRNGKGSVELYSYCEFEQIDRRDKYRLMDISARESNRDGAALRYMEYKLKQRPEHTKLLILVSDGQPADDGYYGNKAIADLRQIRADLRKEGIILIAAAIGSDRTEIENIYGDAYLDISDLQKLPVTLTQLVKHHIKL